VIVDLIQLILCALQATVKLCASFRTSGTITKWGRANAGIDYGFGAGLLPCQPALGLASWIWVPYQPVTAPSPLKSQFDLETAAGWSTAWTLAHGSTIALRVPGAVLSVSSMGYGALARDSGLDLGLTIFINATLFALPAQVVLVDQIARGAALSGAAFAVALTALRLLPMAVSLMPLLRNGDRLPWYGVPATHFVAISTWVEAFTRLPKLPPQKRLTYFVGMGLGMLCATLAGTTMGYVLSSTVPPTIGAALLLMSPTFFLLSQIGTAKLSADWAAVIIGCALGPVLFYVVPGLDLLLSGLIGGTIAFIIYKRRQRT